MKQYFYIDSNNQQIGPISEEALIALLKCGAISRQTLIWAEGLEGWLPYGDVFPENGEEESMPALDDESPIAEPSSAISLKQSLLKAMNRRHLIIGGAVALIAVVFFAVCFSFNSTTRAIDELRELGVISSELDIRDKVGEKAMAQACKQGNYKLVELLIAAGANAEVIEERKSLHGAAEKGHADIVKLLLSVPGVDVNKSNLSRETPLMLAARRGHVEVVKVLLSTSGIDVNRKRDYGWTALYEAMEKNHTEVVKLLLNVPDIDVNIAHSSGSTPLYEAVRNGNTEVVKIMLSIPGIDVNKSGLRKATPLYDAVLNRRIEIVKLLLSAPGVDVNKRSFGNTPLMMAEDLNHTEEIELLRAAGAKK